MIKHLKIIAIGLLAILSFVTLLFGPFLLGHYTDGWACLIYVIYLAYILGYCVYD